MQVFLAALLALAAAAAQAAPLSPADLALLERVTYGVTPADVKEMERLGREGYLREKLVYRGDSSLPHAAKEAIAGLRISGMDIRALAALGNEQREMLKKLSGDQRKASATMLRQQFGELAFESAERRTIRALYSTDQLQELMTWFWFNHFNVFQGKGPVRFLLPDYEESAIRPHVLGRFRDVLMATLTHPAMLVYLDNAQNQRGKINENYARELMELHTMGVDSGYTQADVQALAHILTGATVNLQGRPIPPRSDVYQDGLFVFVPRLHDDTPQNLLGKHVPGSGSFAQIERVVDILARQPATARFISRKLAVYFYGDEPPAALVERMAAEFTRSDGDISRTLHVMFDAPEFVDPTRLPPKFKDAVQYVYSSARLLYAGQVLVNYRPIVGAIAGLGEPLYGHQTPEGYGLREKDWTSPDQLEKRFELARGLPFAQGRLFLPERHEDAGGEGAALAAARREARIAHTIDRAWMEQVVNARYSQKTKATLAKTVSSAEWASIVLSAPEFMYR